MAMRLWLLLRRGTFGIAVLGFISASLSAQATPTQPSPSSWGTPQATSEAAWDTAEAAPDAAWDTAAATSETSWDTVAATVESSWDTAETAPETWGMADAPLTLVWQTSFTRETALIAPGDIAIDKEGNVYISDQTTNLITKYDKDGNMLTQWGGKGSDEGQFNLALGVEVDSDSNVYVTDFYNKRIQKFDSNGKFLTQWTTEPSRSPAFIGMDGQGNVYINEFPPREGHFGQKYDQWGMLVEDWGSDNQQFTTQTEDIAVDWDGNFYGADMTMHRVLKLDPNGKVLATFGGEASEEGNGLFDNPFGISVDEEGYIYVLDGHFLQKLDADGNCVMQWSTAGGDLDRATNVAVDGDGNIYVFAYSDVKGLNGKTINVLLLKKLRQQ